MWSDVLFAMIIGSFVGMGAHVRKRGKIIMPRKTKKFLYLGFLEEVLTGAIAAMLLVSSADASSPLRIVLISIIAGFGGDTLLKGLETLKNDNSSG